MQKNKLKNTPDKRRLSGQAIFPLVLILTAVFGLIGVTFAGASYLQSLLSSQRAFAEQARQAAASGVDDALLRVARDRAWLFPNPGYPLDVDGITATVEVTDTSGGTQTRRQIISSASVRGVERSIQVDVNVSPNGATRVTSRLELTN